MPSLAHSVFSSSLQAGPAPCDAGWQSCTLGVLPVRRRRGGATRLGQQLTQVPWVREQVRGTQDDRRTNAKRASELWLLSWQFSAMSFPGEALPKCEERFLNWSKSCQSETDLNQSSNFLDWYLLCQQLAGYSSTGSNKRSLNSDFWICFISLHKEPCTGNSN